jgi:hypothetical protein
LELFKSCKINVAKLISFVIFLGNSNFVLNALTKGIMVIQKYSYTIGFLNYVTRVWVPMNKYKIMSSHLAILYSSSKFTLYFQDQMHMAIIVQSSDTLITFALKG